MHSQLFFHCMPSLAIVCSGALLARFFLKRDIAYNGLSSIKFNFINQHPEISHYVLADELGDFAPELKLSFFQLGISPQIVASIIMQVCYLLSLNADILFVKMW